MSTAVEVVFYNHAKKTLYRAPSVFNFIGVEDDHWVFGNSTPISFAPGEPVLSTFQIKIDGVALFNCEMDHFDWSPGCTINFLPGAIKIREEFVD